MTRVRDVIDAMRRAYPESAAADWDTGIGLTCGDPDAAVGSVLLAVDADRATIGEAIAIGAGMLVTHHPLLFRPVQSVAADTAKGALLHLMITGGVAHFAAHTNADVAVDGVNDALADALGLIDARPLVPLDGGACVGSAGVGGAGVAGAGVGKVGSGRVGKLPDALSLRAFAAWVADRLPSTVAGVRAAGEPDRIVRTVAVCGGAGDSYLPDAAAAGADVYLTSDLRHHVVGEFVGVAGNPAVVDVAHWAGEWPWLARAATRLAADFPDLTLSVSTLRTDPWTIHVGTVADE
jgi:dinuclear metal center YbgI/SA1388 family protein